MSLQRPMTLDARRSGLDAFRAVLRRRNPGTDVVFKLERHDRVDDPTTGEIGRALTTPEDPDTVGDGFAVAPAAAVSPNEHRIDEPADDLTALVEGEI